MKRRITGTVALLAGAFVAHSQGQILFANYYGNGPYNYVSIRTPFTTTKLGGTSTVTTGTSQDFSNGGDWTVALYGNAGWNDPSGSLKPAVIDGTQFQPATVTLAGGGTGAYLGTWFTTIVTDIPGVSFGNQPATVQLYAWYNAGGRINSYAAALADGFPTGFSATANVITGGVTASGAPTSWVTLPVFKDGGGGGEIVFNVGTIPEPSTVILSVIGAAAAVKSFSKK